MKFFPKKKYHKLEINNLIGIIEPTEVASENGSVDNFNKSIKIRNGVRYENGQIMWGKLIDEIPFSEEALYSLIEIKNIPILERRLSEPLFLEDETSGGISI